jgi:hypothetical protein
MVIEEDRRGKFSTCRGRPGDGVRARTGYNGPVPGPLDSAYVKAAALRAGFSKCGIARAEPLDPAPLDRLLAMGGEADMAWLRTQRAERLDPARLLPGVRSVGGA